jgi:hypothetical protein
MTGLIISAIGRFVATNRKTGLSGKRRCVRLIQTGPRLSFSRTSSMRRGPRTVMAMSSGSPRETLRPSRSTRPKTVSWLPV